MQKKLLTVAIGAALASPLIAAQADVTVYGAAQFEWAMIDNGGSRNYPGTPSSLNKPNGSILAGTDANTTLDNKRGRFGVKADEDLGNGWKGTAHFEWQVDTSDSSDSASMFSERITTVGISQKSIGHLRFGQDHSPYKASGVALDPFVTTALEARNNYGMSGNKDGWGIMNAHNGFVQNGLFFNSASWAGAYVNAYFGLDHTGAERTCSTLWTTQCSAAGAANERTAGDISAVAGWKGNAGPVGLNVFAGYSLMGSATTAAQTDDPSALKFAGQVTVAKAHTITLQIEKTDLASVNTWANKADYLFVGYAGKFGPVTAVAQLGKMTADADDTTPGINYEGNYLAVGAIYNMSKTFRIFGGYRSTKLEASPAFTVTAPIREENVISLGMRKDF